MALAPSAKPFLTGGLQDSAVDAGLQKFVPEIWGQAIMDYMEKTLVLGNLAQDLSPLVAGGGDLIHLPKHDEITASDLYGGNSEALQSDTNVGITFDDTTTAGGEYQLILNQSNYAALAISDLVKAQSSYDLMNIYTRKLGYALAKKIDAYLFIELFKAIAFNAANDGSTDGAQAGNIVQMCTASSRNIDQVGVANMVQAIYENDSRQEDYTLILTPASYASLFKLDEVAIWNGVGNTMAGGEVPLISGFVGKIGGVNVVVSNNFQDYGTDSTTQQQTTAPVFNDDGSATGEADELCGFLMHKDCLKIAYSAGMKARVQSDYDLTSLSTRFVADTVYGGLVTGSTTAGNKLLYAISHQ